MSVFSFATMMSNTHVHRVMCSVYDTKSDMFFTRECAPVYNRTQTAFTSNDLYGQNYVGVCPYFENCALSSSGTCSSDDFRCEEVCSEDA